MSAVDVRLSSSSIASAALGSPQRGNSANRHRQCPLCERDNGDQPPSPYSIGEWVIKKCAACQFVYLENALSYDALVEDYCWTKNFGVEREARRRAEPVISRLSSLWKTWRSRLLRRVKEIDLVRRFVPPGNVLDVGCASGATLRRLDATYVPFGIEIEAKAAASAHAFAAQRGGQVVAADALRGLQGFPDQLFQGVVLRSFLEHENSPRAVLDEVWRVLVSGGIAIVKVPNFGSLNRIVRGNRWCGFRFPDHVNYFTPETLRRILHEARFEIVRFNFFDHSPVSDNMWLIARRPKFLSNEY